MRHTCFLRSIYLIRKEHEDRGFELTQISFLFVTNGKILPTGSTVVRHLLSTDASALRDALRLLKCVRENPQRRTFPADSQNRCTLRAAQEPCARHERNEVMNAREDDAIDLQTARSVDAPPACTRSRKQASPKPPSDPCFNFHVAVPPPSRQGR
jgi:hypothetical protein